MKICTYNVNGIRAALNKGLLGLLESVSPNIICFQELKATEDQIPVSDFRSLGYHCYWYPAERKGYSGTAILSKEEPLSVVYGCGDPLFDSEGRSLVAHYKDFSVLSTYFPSGSSGSHRQDVKMAFLEHFYDYIQDLKKQHPNLIICGDYNICHKHIDIHDPVSNKNSSGFLPEERAWMDRFFDSGFTDSFRLNEPGPDHYTWWSYRAGARARNKGWRIDYIAVSEPLKNHIGATQLYPQAQQSDHCAMTLNMKWGS